MIESCEGEDSMRREISFSNDSDAREEEDNDDEEEVARRNLEKVELKNLRDEVVRLKDAQHSLIMETISKDRYSV